MDRYLKLFNTKYLDVFMIHNPDPNMVRTHARTPLPLGDWTLLMLLPPSMRRRGHNREADASFPRPPSLKPKTTRTPRRSPRRSRASSAPTRPRPSASPTFTSGSTRRSGTVCGPLALSSHCLSGGERGVVYNLLDLT